MRDLLARLDGWRGERSRREPSYVQRLTRSVIYGEGMRVRDHIPEEPSSRRRLSAWLQEKLDLLHATLRAHCRGQVGGPAIGVAAAADHRSASPHTWFRLF